MPYASPEELLAFWETAFTKRKKERESRKPWEPKSY